MEGFTIPLSTPEQDPEHDAAMIAKADGVQTDQPLLAGKYKSEEELAKGYLELLKKQGNLEDQYKALEAQLGRPKEVPPETATVESTDEPAATEPETPKADVPEPIRKAASVLSRAGLDSEKVIAEYAETGELKPEYYEALATKAGLDRDVVDQFLEGQKAIMDRATQTVLNAAGGEAQYNAMVQWAVTGVSKAEADAFNSTLAEGDMGKVLLAVQGLRAKFEQATSAPISGEPKLVQGGAGVSPAQTGYASEQEMTRDMADPRYRKDPAFQDYVIRKAARSRF